MMDLPSLICIILVGTMLSAPNTPTIQAEGKETQGNINPLHPLTLSSSHLLSFYQGGETMQTRESERNWSRIEPLFTPPEAYRGDLGSYPSALTFADGRAVRTAADWKRRRRELLKEWETLLGSWPPLL